MASGSVWGIDIGKSSLKAVRMRRGKDELEVQALFFEEYKPAEDGTIPPSESSRALEALLAKYTYMRKERVFVALPGHTSFSRFIKLPAFDPRKLGEMVRFEAQQQIPHAISDVNWDFSLVEREYEADEDREVGIFAIKKEVVYAFMADLQLSGLEPHAITTAPLAIYNFVRWDMELPEDQATVVLDIGWDHTDLVIVDGARYWVRNLALNGHELTKAIATKLKVSFLDAEEQKRQAAQNKDARKLYQATELVLKDFVAEIQRSIAFYKSTNKDRQITVGQVLLLGNGSKLPNVRPFFQKELGFPVETVKRLQRLTLDVDIEGDEVELLKEHLPTFAVAFGLGIQGAGDALNNVNLVPEEIRQKQVLEAKKPLVAAAVAVIWLTVLASWFMAGRSLEKLQVVLKDANRNLAWLKENQTKIEAAREPIEGLQSQMRSLAALTSKRNLPLEVLNKLAGILPKNDAEIIGATIPQQKDLSQGKQTAKVEAVKRALAEAQDKTNDGKTWILEIAMKPTDSGGVRCSLLCARKYVRNAQGFEDEAATKTALETGLLAEVKRVFPKAGFDGAPRKIFNLDKDANVPATPGGFGATTQQAFCGLTIAFDYDGADLVSAAAPPPKPVAEAPR